MAPTSGDDELLALRALARRAGIPESTLRSWTKLDDRPLDCRRDGDAVTGSTLANLRAFCAAHPRRPKAAVALAQLDNPPPAAVDPEMVQAVLGTLGAAVAAVRAATAAQLDIAQTSAGQAADTAAACRGHAAALTAALSGLDDVLTRFTPFPGR